MPANDPPTFVPTFVISVRERPNDGFYSDVLRVPASDVGWSHSEAVKYAIEAGAIKRPGVALSRFSDGFTISEYVVEEVRTPGRLVVEGYSRSEGPATLSYFISISFGSASEAADQAAVQFPSRGWDVKAHSRSDAVYMAIDAGHIARTCRALVSFPRTTVEGNPAIDPGVSVFSVVRLPDETELRVKA